MQMHAFVNKNSVLSLLLVVVAAVILLRLAPASVDPVVMLKIAKNRTEITNIYQPRDISNRAQVSVDRLALRNDSRLRHAELGDIGFGGDFFVDINHPFTVEEAGRYYFVIGSDDGFTLSIDGDRICDFTGSRPFDTQTCGVTLDEGDHGFKLSYFQGYGDSGLTVQYRKARGKSYYFGENSPFMTFH